MRLALSLAAVLAAAGSAVCVAGLSMADDSLGAADRRAIIAEVGYEADEGGRVENICGDVVEPQFLAAEIGGSVGVAELVIIPGGASDCYGDAPGDMYLMTRSRTGFHVVFADSGRMAILPSTSADGVHDIALNRDGTYPVFNWDGDDYVWSGRNISRSEFSAAPSLP